LVFHPTRNNIMRKLITIILLLWAGIAQAQTYQLNYDSIRVGKTAGTGSTSMYGKVYLKNVSLGLVSDSMLVVRNGRIFKVLKTNGTVTSVAKGFGLIADGTITTTGTVAVDSAVMRTVANSRTLAQTQAALNLKADLGLYAPFLGGVSAPLPGDVYLTRSDPTIFVTRTASTNQMGMIFRTGAAVNNWYLGVGLSNPGVAATNLELVNPVLSQTALSVNNSTNAISLPPLSTNGLLKTSGGTGLLSIATAGTDYVIENSPTFTGTPVAPTATAGTNTTQLATTAFVTTADNLKANIASPTLVTPVLGNATGGTLGLSGALTGTSATFSADVELSTSLILGKTTTQDIWMKQGATLRIINQVYSVANFTLDNNGNLLIAGSNATKTSGTAWINPSDSRLKENIIQYNKGLNEIMLINPKTWNYNKESGFDTTKLHLSPIAQELQEVMPEMVSTYKGKLNGKETELLQVDASDMTWLMVKAIQELNAKITALELRIKLLKAKP